LADLELWTRCGREALAAQVRSDGTQSETYEKSRRTSESVLARTAGFVALQRQDYRTAEQELNKAASLNPQDALTYLWLSTTAFGGDKPDLNAGIFYFARAEELSPQIPQFSSILRQSYVTVHGSEKGIEKLREVARSNAAPPPGFNILPKPKKERHYGTAVAASAIVALLVYGAVKHPDFMTALGQSLGDGSNASGTSGQGKLMIFAGSSHETYLGCLNCAEAAPDSISNEYGQNGSRYSQASIWNHYSQFASAYAPYSACNPYSTDPPVIVDDAGTYYGRLTLNEFHPELGAGRQLIDWLKQVVCVQ
jgi:tetratricopeptide (TPR) repeat protein